jgi:hypothetical protein
VRDELTQALEVLLAAGVGWLAQKMRSIPKLEGSLADSRKDQGQRIGVLEDRVSKLEAMVNALTRRGVG